MEVLVRKPEAKIAGTKASKTIPKEYKNTSLVIVGSTVALYIFSIIFRLTDFEIYPLIFYRSCEFKPSLMNLIPILVSIYAFLLRYWAMSVLGKYFSRKLVVQGSQEIIQEGPYALIRHPGYSANVVLYFIYSLIVSGDLIIGLLLWFQYLFVLLTIRIPSEEEMLLSNPQTTDPYKRYQTVVRHKIIPFLI